MRVIISLLVLLCTVKTMSLGLDQKVLPIIEKNNLKSKFLIWESDIPKYILWNRNVLGNKSQDSLTTKLIYPDLDSLQVTVLILDLNKDKTKDFIFNIDGYDSISGIHQYINYGLEVTDLLVFSDSLKIGDIIPNDKIGVFDKYTIQHREVSDDDRFKLSKVLIERKSKKYDTLTSVSSSINNSKNVKISIFPNPVTEFISVKSHVSKSSTDIIITHYLVDTSGKILRSASSNLINNDIVKFELSDYGCGTYYIISKCDGVLMEVNKFVKQ